MGSNCKAFRRKNGQFYKESLEFDVRQLIMLLRILVQKKREDLQRKLNPLGMPILSDPRKEGIIVQGKNMPCQIDEKIRDQDIPCQPEVKDPPYLFQPAARVSAFSIYSPVSGQTSGSLLSRPIHEPLFQFCISGGGVANLLDSFCCEPEVPSRCGHSCCGTWKESSQSSLLGPEFIEYVEPPPISSQELASVAADLSSIA